MSGGLPLVADGVAVTSVVVVAYLGVVDAADALSGALAAGRDVGGARRRLKVANDALDRVAPGVDRRDLADAVRAWQAREAPQEGL